MVRSFILIEKVFRAQLVWRAHIPQDYYVSIPSIWSASEGATPEQEFPQHVIYRWTRRLASAIII
jgi:hypothetical protein